MWNQSFDQVYSSLIQPIKKWMSLFSVGLSGIERWEYTTVRNSSYCELQFCQRGIDLDSALTIAACDSTLIFHDILSGITVCELEYRRRRIVISHNSLPLFSSDYICYECCMSIPYFIIHYNLIITWICCSLPDKTWNLKL
jgi:hypothetical protein